MSNTIIKVENISKQYRLGEIGTGTLSHDLNRWWAKVRGKEDPFLKIGETNDRTQKGNSDYVWALKDINFEVKQGEVLGIIGRNGAGKSTLLKILSKTTTPTTGSIKVKGRIASLLEVGTGFHPELSGRDNIFLNGAILGMNKQEIKSKFDEIVDFSGVERYLDTPVKRYSSGMYVRLAFAVAAHLEPEILIVDEVLAVGDAEFQKKCLGKMKDVSVNDGRTVLFVSHNMTAVEQLCNKGFLIENGTSKFSGDINDSIRKYLSNGLTEDVLVTDLKNAKRSNGKYKIISKAWIENDAGYVVKRIQIGDSFKIKFTFHAEFDIVNVLFGFGIENNQGMRITSLNNEIIGSEIVKSIRTGEVWCTLDNPNLMDGDYYISLSVVSNQNEWIDYIAQAISFKIEPKDIYGTGKIIENSQGLIYLHGDISIH
jgi:lipopolysaccharide transport system ATP-binding protein